MTSIKTWPKTRQSERLDVEADCCDVALVAVAEEANNATVVLDGDVEGHLLLDPLTISIRPVGTQVGDDCEVGYAIGLIITEMSAQPVNFLHELMRLKGNLRTTQTSNVTIISPNKKHLDDAD